MSTFFETAPDNVFLSICAHVVLPKHSSTDSPEIHIGSDLPYPVLRNLLPLAYTNRNICHRFFHKPEPEFWRLLLAIVGIGRPNANSDIGWLDIATEIMGFERIWRRAVMVPLREGYDEMNESRLRVWDRVKADHNIVLQPMVNQEYIKELIHPEQARHVRVNLNREHRRAAAIDAISPFGEDGTVVDEAIVTFDDLFTTSPMTEIKIVIFPEAWMKDHMQPDSKDWFIVKNPGGITWLDVTASFKAFFNPVNGDPGPFELNERGPVDIAWRRDLIANSWEYGSVSGGKMVMRLTWHDNKNWESDLLGRFHSEWELTDDDYREMWNNEVEAMLGYDMPTDDYMIGEEVDEEYSDDDTFFFA